MILKKFHAWIMGGMDRLFYLGNQAFEISEPKPVVLKNSNIDRYFFSLSQST